MQRAASARSACALSWAFGVVESFSAAKGWAFFGVRVGVKYVVTFGVEYGVKFGVKFGVEFGIFSLPPCMDGGNQLKFGVLTVFGVAILLNV